MTDLFDSIEKGFKSVVTAHESSSKGQKVAVDFSTKGVTLNEPVELNKLAAFLNTTLGDTVELPNFPTTDFKLESFELVRADASAQRPFSFDLAVSFGESISFEVIDGFELTLLEIAIGYWGEVWTCKIEGKITIHDLPFRVSLDWPSKTIQGQLVRGEKPDLGKLVEKHGLAVVSGGSTPTLEILSVYIAAGIPYVSLHLAASNLIQLGPVKLEEVDLRLEYAGGLNSRFSGAVYADVSIGKINFELSAERNETGWLAQAEAEGDGTLEDLVKALSVKLYGVNNELSLVNDAGIPASIASKELHGDIKLVVDTADSHVTLTAAVLFNDKDGSSAVFEIAVGPGALSATALLKLGDLSFEVDFSKEKSNRTLVAQFVSEQGLSMSMDKLLSLADFSGNTSALPKANAEFSITLRDVLLAIDQPKPGDIKMLLAADLDGGIDLSGLGSLPLVGDMLPANLSLSLSMAPIYANKEWDSSAVKRIDGLRQSQGPELGEKVAAGTSLGVSLKLPGERLPTEIGLGLDDIPDATNNSAGSSNTPAPGAVTWKKIEKKLGPVEISRIGLALNKSDKSIKVLLDASLGLGGLELSLVGLGAVYKLPDKTISFELHGMGLDINKPPLRIAGAFAEFDGDYVGKVLLSLTKFSLSASGGFKMLDGTPSMFLYGVLNTPLGGPPFFFVEGVAAGFGYNRNLTAPFLKDVHNFPFVTDAIGAASGAAGKTVSISEQLRLLHEYVQPQLGQYFLAAGIKFTSFKLIDSFVLLILGFGREFKIDLLGIATYQTPPIMPEGIPAMARVELNLMASIRPQSGSLLVQAELGENSYVYASLCKLSGGFAFGAWFAGPHAGDFVVSAGGYHPLFKRKENYPHYPTVSRIALTFQITPNIYVRGSAYFALTPSMFMAGAALVAHAEVGSISANFRLSMDFLIGWEPYHYDASLSVDITAKWSFFSTSAHAGVHIWGPPFAGHAEVHWTVISFDIDFGSAARGATPISWDKFCQSFLPHIEDKSASHEVNIIPGCTLAAGQIGSRATPGSVGPPVLIVNPKEVQIVIDCIVPFSTLKYGTAANVSNPANADPVGCGPTGVGKVHSAELEISISGVSGADAAFTPQIELKAFPKAMWGPNLSPDIHDEKASIQAGGVVLLTPAKPINQSEPENILRGDVKYDPEKPKAIKQQALTPFRYQPTADKNIKDDALLSSALVAGPNSHWHANRNAILEGLGLVSHTVQLHPQLFAGIRSMPLMAKGQ